MKKGVSKKSFDRSSLIKAKGLYDAVLGRMKSRALPVLYRNPLSGRLLVPELKVAYLEVTNKCNLRCKMCIYSKMKQESGFMSQRLFESCVNQLSDMGVETLNLHFGGESLVHPRFKELLKYAVDKRNQGKIGSVSWIDNGMLFTRDIADLVVDLGVDLVGFSIDGIGDVNDSIRLGSDYSVIEKNIKYLIKKRGSGKPRVYVSMCEYGKTEKEKDAVYREWVPFVDSITLIPSILPDNKWDKSNVVDSEMVDPPAFCAFPFETMAISWNGKVTGCCLDYVFDMDFGDATKEPLKKIWRNEKYQALRKAALQNSFPAKSLCYQCEFWKINFKPNHKVILDGEATIDYGHIYRVVKRNIQ